MNRLKRIHSELLDAIEGSIKEFTTLIDVEQKRKAAEIIQFLSTSHREIVESMDQYTEALFDDMDEEYLENIDEENGFEIVDKGRSKRKRKKTKIDDNDLPF